MSLKKAYEQKFEAQLKEWNAEIEKLKTKAGKAKAEAHIAYHENIEKIKEKKKKWSKKNWLIFAPPGKMPGKISGPGLKKPGKILKKPLNRR